MYSGFYSKNLSTFSKFTRNTFKVHQFSLGLIIPNFPNVKI